MLVVARALKRQRTNTILKLKWCCNVIGPFYTLYLKRFHNGLTYFLIRNYNCPVQSCTKVLRIQRLTVWQYDAVKLCCKLFRPLSQTHISCSSPWRPGETCCNNNEPMRSCSQLYRCLCSISICSGSSVCICSYGGMSSYRQPCCGVQSQWHHVTGRCFHLILLV